MTVTWTMLLTVCPLVFLAAVIDAIGGGGGLISLPAYYLAGLPPVLAAGTNKFSASFGTLMASVRYGRQKKVRWLCGLLAVAGALPGAWCGAEVLKRTPESVVRMCLLIGVPLIAILMFVRKVDDRPDTGTEPQTVRERVLCFVIGLCVGFYDGFFGPGTGTILIALFTWLLHLGAVEASGTAKIVNLASNISALISLTRGGDVLFALGLPAMACSVLGGLVGSGLAIKRGAKLIRVVMVLVMILLLVKVGYDFFAGQG